ncbi:FAD-dependent oxidoreductase [Shewanella sp. A14]
MKKRTFFKSVLAVSALTLLNCGSTWAATIEMSTDIVIVGGGASGMAAGTQASQLGAKVIILEKQAKNGGTGNYAEGLFAAESSLQQHQGIVVTPEYAFKTIMDYSHWKANAALVSAFVNKSASTIDWLQDMGVKFKYIGAGAAGGPMTWHVIDGYSKQMIKTFTEQFEKNGGKLLLNTPGQDLIIEDGKIAGVKAKNKDGDDVIIHAKSVIISTGGFANNKEMMKQYSPYPELIPVGQMGKDGDGIKMAWKAGAAEEGVHVMQSYRPGLKGFHPANQMIAAAVQPYLWIDEEGHRYTDESSVELWPFAGNALERLGGTAYSIYDQATHDKFVKSGNDMHLGNWVHANTPLVELDKEFNKELKRNKGNVYKANTIEDLAKQMKIDPAILKETIARNNKAAATRNDDQFFKKPKFLRDVSKGPFYATKLHPRFLGTLGGVKVNEKTQAMSATTKAPIPGLFVTGNDAGGLYGDSYDLIMGGSTLGFAVNSGRIAAENAVKTIKK